MMNVRMEDEIIKKNIPDSEVWLFEDAEALEAIRTGLKEAAEGKVSKINLDDL